MREFVTAVTRAHDEEADEANVIKIDGRQYTYYPPTDGQFAMYMVNTGRRSTVDDKIGAVVDFFLGMFDSEDQSILSNRLLDRDDDFGMEMVKQIMDSMVEEWSGRPTKRSTGSTSSQTSAGPRSTRPTRKSTSSRSR